MAGTKIATIRLRRDTAANWTTNNPVLAAGEMGIELGGTRAKIKIGDGVKTWTQLDYIGSGDVVTAWEETLSDDKVPSEKLTKETIDLKQDIFQVSVMPTPTASLVGKGLFLYVGTTTTVEPIYDHNGWYECQEVTPATESATYKWTKVPMSGVWGQIVGTLNDQTDLVAALNARVGIGNFTSLTEWHGTLAEYNALPTHSNLVRYNITDDILEIASALVDLDDVAVSDLQDGDILYWDADTERFVNGQPSTPTAVVVWGQITGTLTNQTDLITYITNAIATAVSGYVAKGNYTSLTEWKGTKAQYEALEEYDNNVRYTIIDDDDCLPANLSDLDDVTLSSLQNGQFLVYNGTTHKWYNYTLVFPELVWGNVTGDIEDQEDLITYIEEATDGFVERGNYSSLTEWKGTKAQYEAITTYDPNVRYSITDDDAAEVLSLTNLNDVNVTNPTDGQLLKYDATNNRWINYTLTFPTTDWGDLGGDIEDQTDLVAYIENATSGFVTKGNYSSLAEWKGTLAQYNALTSYDANTRYTIVDDDGAEVLVLTNMGDVNITNPVDGQLLKYDAVNDRWINFTLTIPATNWGGISGTLTNQTDLVTYISNAVSGFVNKGNYSTLTEWKGTLAEYNALATYDNNVRYTITDDADNDTVDFNGLVNRPKYNGTAMTNTTDIPEVKTEVWDAKSEVSGTNDGTNWTSLTVNGTTKNIPVVKAPVSISVTSAGWVGSAAPYTQSVSVTGMTASDYPMVSCNFTNLAMQKEYSKISKCEAGAGIITFTCFEEKPTIDLTLVVR